MYRGAELHRAYFSQVRIIVVCCCVHHMFRCKHIFSTSSHSILLPPYGFLITNLYFDAPCASSKRRPDQLLNPSHLYFGLFLWGKPGSSLSHLGTFSIWLPFSCCSGQPGGGPFGRKDRNDGSSEKRRSQGVGAQVDPPFPPSRGRVRPKDIQRAAPI